MEYYMNSAGVNVPCIREYEIDTAYDLRKGAVVTLVHGKAEKAADGDVILGILAEDYKVEKEELNPRSGSGRVRVVISPGMICRQASVQMTVAEKGTATTLGTAGITMPGTADALVGGYIKLIYKGASSTNTDRVGLARAIEASNGTKLTVEAGGIPNVGDIYAIIPPAGFSALALSDDAENFVFASAANADVQVVCALPENDFCEIGFKNTFIG